MPKIIDHEKRKQLIAEATWRVISKQGMKGATVRNIAKEAGMSLGALRHYFPSQDRLLEFSMNLVKERVMKRIQMITASPMPPKEKVVSALMEIIPSNETTRAEMEVWMEFVFHYRNSGLPEKGNDGIRDGIAHLINLLNSCGILKPNRDLDFEIERLYALIDGLAVHAVMEPDRLTAEKIRSTLERHLDEICIFPH